MEEALRALNQLVTDGVIANYAIGGAMGAAFYISAQQTENLDAFVLLPPEPAELVLTPVYEALAALGGKVEREYVRFGPWFLQILTAPTSLIAEAIREAVDVQFGEVPMRVFRPEHLYAIALQLGQDEDRLRVSAFLRKAVLNKAALNDLLARYDPANKLGSSMQIDEEKMAFNLRAKASMRLYLQSLSWEEKVRSIERMREADVKMKAAMREALAKERRTADPEQGD